MAEQARVEVARLVKVFGGNIDLARERLSAGADRQEILRETGAVVAVDDVSFAVNAGETFVVMGLSGSGKSTLLRCINRLIMPSAGQVLIDGEDVIAADGARLREIRLSKLGMVFQHFALFPHKSVAGNVEYGLKVRGVPPSERREKALEWLDVVGLADWADRAPEELSGGMKQRVGLARALAVEPEVLMMDEPFSALDPLIRRDMQEELIELQRRFRKSIIFITHDLHEALKLGDRIAIMKEGRFVQLGTPADIVDRPAIPYVAAFTRDVDRSRVLTARAVLRPDGALRAAKADAEAVLVRLQASGARGIHLLDENDRPVGLVLREAAARVARTTAGGLAGAMQKRFPQVNADAQLLELFGPCREGLPIAVVDGSGRFVGTVEPLDVFGEMVGPSEETMQPAAPSSREA